MHGENFDGNRFIEHALGAGAIAAVSDDTSLTPTEKVLVVSNTLEALQQLGQFHRRQMPATVMAITGSNGKTTSKELVKAVLSTTYNVVASEGNLNNHIGVPLTLLRLKPEHRFAVIEMGANHRGEIAGLCSIAEPEYGAVTNVGKAHLEGFGGLEGVIAAKKELFDHLAAHDGVAFVNPELPHLAEMVARVKKRVTYGEHGAVSAIILEEKPTLRVEIAWTDGVMPVHSQLIGRYNANNILLAAAAGLHFGVAPEKVREGIESYVPSSNRSQILRRDSTTIILDAYNANPSSMEAALENLRRMDAQVKVAILGDMLELGDYSDAEHARIAALAAESGDQVVLVGPQFAKVGTGLRFDNTQSCKEWFDRQRFLNAAILIKGSRKIGLEALVQSG